MTCSFSLVASFSISSLRSLGSSSLEQPCGLFPLSTVSDISLSKAKALSCPLPTLGITLPGLPQYLQHESSLIFSLLARAPWGRRAGSLGIPFRDFIKSPPYRFQNREMDSPTLPCAIKVLKGNLEKFFYTSGEPQLDTSRLERRCLGEGKNQNGL